MDFRIVLKTLGQLLIIEAVSLIAPLGISLVYHESDTVAFLITIVITSLVGLVLTLNGGKEGNIGYKEGFMIVGIGWLLVSLFGSVPFMLAGTFESFIDAFFESVSGFTTTGATVLTNIEVQPHGILFWRAFTQWLGGMGILVFTLAMLPAMGVSSVRIFQAESPGPNQGTIVPKITKTALFLYIIYFIFTLLEIISLKIAGMPLFESVTHSFATMGTGGYSIKNNSIGFYNKPSYEWIIIFYMLLSGANFTLYYDALVGNFKTLIKDKEFQLYIIISIISILLIILNITDSWKDITLSFRQATFQVVSIISTTGFTSLDYSIWPDFSKIILLILMFIGGCAGSTAGAIKNIRLLIIFKYIKREFYKLVHPKSVITIQVGDKTIPDNIVHNVIAFVMIYMLIFAGLSVFLVSQSMDLISSISAAAATLGNVGPGFNLVGPAMNYSNLSTLTKIILSFAMIIGRLEIYTVLILMAPFFWKY
ncbi:MAG: TrkH family potassium uptake protein [Firmicutes bacterium]|nr:TrkH family potassium uptake protein [Bacillota bacterium]